MINQNLIEAYINDADSIPRNHKTYIAFVLYWSLFEALIKDKTNIIDNTIRAIKEITLESNYLQNGWNKIAKTNWVGLIGIIKKYCPIYDKRFNHLEKPIDITKPTDPDLGELIMILYRLRSNLLHGHDDFRSDNNIELYTACRDILAQWTKQLV